MCCLGGPSRKKLEGGVEVEKAIYTLEMCPRSTAAIMSWNIQWAEERAITLKEVLCKYGLEKDQQALWAIGVSHVDDIPWMSADAMRDPRLTGILAQYVAMQEGESAEDDPEVRTAQSGDFGPQ